MTDPASDRLACTPAWRTVILLVFSVLAAVVLLAVSSAWDAVARSFGTAGARVEYFADRDFARKVKRTHHEAIAWDYGASHPVPRLGEGGYAARWTAELQVPIDDTYQFFIQSRHGVRVWIDGELLVDNWRDVTWRGSGKRATKDLEQGPHRLKVEHYCNDAEGAIKLKWAGGSIPRDTVIAEPFLSKKGIPLL